MKNSWLVAIEEDETGSIGINGGYSCGSRKDLTAETARSGALAGSVGFDNEKVFVWNSCCVWYPR